MKLNPDCVRDLLIDIEESTDPHHSALYVFSSPMEGRLAPYSNDEIAYHLEQCNLNGYLVDYTSYSGDEIEVRCLSPAGHAFLEDIRSDTVWNHTKSVAGKIGTWSLGALNKIAVSVVTELIKRQIG